MVVSWYEGSVEMSVKLPFSVTKRAEYVQKWVTLLTFLDASEPRSSVGS